MLAALLIPTFAALLGDRWGWVADVFGRIADVSIYWLVLALALKTAESAFIGLGWRNILRAAFRTLGCPSRPHGVPHRAARRSTPSRRHRPGPRR